MECSRCSHVPVICKDNVKVHVSLPTNHHLADVEKRLSECGYHWVEEDGNIVVEVERFEGFIFQMELILPRMMEQIDTLILPMSEDQFMSFGLIREAKSLNKWVKLLRYSDLLFVLNNRSIKVLFQPIIHGKTGHIYGYEALSRGIDEEGGIITPDRLFSMAKEVDLLFNLDRLCREEIISRASSLGLKDKLFINFIPTAIYDPNKCLSTTDEAVKKSSLNRDQIIFEVVETEYVEDFAHLNHILDFYRDKGYETALDDMGSGYANEEMLTALKPNYIKIDLSIVRNIHLNEENQNRLQTYRHIAELQNSQILAEGVETEEEMIYLKRVGVDYFQGYFFSKPNEGLRNGLSFNKYFS